MRLRRAFELPQHLAKHWKLITSVCLLPHRSETFSIRSKHCLLSVQNTGYSVEVISAEDEALFGYAGAMQELRLTSGAFVDIGGASTEIVTFKDSIPVDFDSFPIGSLNLYRRCVKKILPAMVLCFAYGKQLKLLSTRANIFLFRTPYWWVSEVRHAPALKLARHYYDLPGDCHSMTAEQLDGLCTFLCSNNKEASD